MKLIIVSGYLGSGKTTLLLKMVKALGNTSARAAIIENEIGEIGIDGKYLAREGLNIQELNSGCVCCTLASDLVLTLQKLKRVCSPEIVILEASGVARPEDITKTVQKYCTMVKITKVLTVVDAARFTMFAVMLPILTKSQVGSADYIAINKRDEVDGYDLEAVVEGVKKLNSTAGIWSVSAETDEKLPLLEWLF